MNKQRCLLLVRKYDLHITPFRSQNFQIKGRNEVKHNSVDFGFFPFYGAPVFTFFEGVKNDYFLYL